MEGRGHVRFLALVIAAAIVGCGGDDTPARGERDAGHRPDSGPPPGRDGGPDAGPSADDARTLARAAVVMSSCLGGSAGELLFQAYGAVAPPHALSSLLREHALCLATEGGGCEAVDACLGIELDVAGDCTEGCDGDTAVFCGGGHARWRCADVGLTCADGACVPATEACTDSGCVDDQPVVCTDGVASLGPVCADHGMSCDAAAVSGDPGCVGSGETCTPTAATSTAIAWFDDAIACVDDTHLASCVNGARQEVACSDLFDGMRCRTTSEVDPRAFCGLSNECNPFTTVVEFCSGSSVAVCNAGRLENVGCESLGFTRCTTGHCE